MLRRLTDFARAHWSECAVIALSLVFGLGVFVGMHLAGGSVHTEEHQTTELKDEQLHQEHAAAAVETSQGHQVERLVVYRKDGTKKLERTREGERLEHRVAVAAASTDVRTVERVEYRDREVIKTSAPSWRVGVVAGVDARHLSDQQLLGPVAFGAQLERRLLGPVWIGAFGFSSGHFGLSLTLEL